MSEIIYSDSPDHQITEFINKYEYFFQDKEKVLRVATELDMPIDDKYWEKWGNKESMKNLRDFVSRRDLHKKFFEAILIVFGSYPRYGAMVSEAQKLLRYLEGTSSYIGPDTKKPAATCSRPSQSPCVASLLRAGQKHTYSLEPVNKDRKRQKGTSDHTQFKTKGTSDHTIPHDSTYLDDSLGNKGFTSKRQKKTSDHANIADSTDIYHTSEIMEMEVENTQFKTKGTSDHTRPQDFTCLNASVESMGIDKEDDPKEVFSWLSDSNINLQELCIDRSLATDSSTIAAILEKAIENPCLQRLSIEGDCYLHENMEIFILLLCSLKQLKTLTLKHMDVKKGQFIKTLFDNLIKSEVALESIFLQCNRIDDEDVVHVVNYMNKALQIKEVSLADNQITDAGAIQLAKINQHMRRACKLDLSMNQIGITGALKLLKSWVPLGTYNKKHEINLDGNQIQTDVLKRHKFLCSFSVMDNTLGSERVSALVSRIRSGESYRIINLRGILLTDNDIKQVTRLVYNGLHQLNIADNKLTAASVPFLTELCLKYKNIEKIDITNTNIDGDVIEMFTSKMDQIGSKAVCRPYFLSGEFHSFLDEPKQDFLLENRKLHPCDIATCFHLLRNIGFREMKFANCKITESDISVFRDHVYKYIETTEVLYFCSNELDDASSKILAQQLMKILGGKINPQEAKGLRRLTVRDNNVSPEAVESLVKLATYCNNLSFLDLSGNGFGSKGCKVLQKLAKCSKVKILNLAANRIDNSGMEAIADLVKNDKTLTAISIAMNAFSATGLKSLVGSLEENKHITFLDISKNAITSKHGIFRATDAKKLWVNVLTKTGLETLIARETSISDEILEEMEKASLVESPLRKVDFARNEISHTGMRHLLSIFRDSKITHLDISEQSHQGAPGFPASEELCITIAGRGIPFSYIGLRNMHGIDKDEALAIAKAMGETCPNSILDMSNNFLPKETTRKLVRIRIEHNAPRSVLDNTSGEQNFFDSPFV